MAIWDLEPPRRRGAARKPGRTSRASRRRSPSLTRTTDKLIDRTSDLMLAGVGIVAVANIGGAMINALDN